MHSAIEIIPGLWLGNLRARSDLEFIQRKKIKLIINCCSQNLNNRYNIPSIDCLADSKELFLNLSDREHEKSMNDMFKTIPLITKQIDKHLNQGDTILVHCYAGRRRSPAIVMAYLMSKCGWSTAQVIKIVKHHWPHTINSFVKVLTDYEISQL